MKRIGAIIASLMILIPVSVFSKKNAEPVAIKVISYNIRTGAAKDGTNSWELRYPATGLMLKDQQPDIFGVQEALSYQVLYIQEVFPEYKCVGVGREDGKSKGEHMSIFYNKKRFSLVKWGTFWLSETPDKVSKGWDAECMRTATWTLLKDRKSGRKFYYVNTHLDHMGAKAQTNGLSLIVDRISAMNKEGLPLILTGDFNIRPNNPALTENLDHKMKSARKFALKTDNLATANDWGRNRDKNKIIDYIYFSGFSSCTEYSTITKKYGQWNYISDHYPVSATLVF